VPILPEIVAGSLGRYERENTRGAPDGHDDVATWSLEEISVLLGPVVDTLVLVWCPGYYCGTGVSDEDNIRSDRKAPA
jgi:hypothetical protein